MKLQPFGSRRRRLLANAVALLILAGASGVLAALLIGWDPSGAAPEGAEHAAGAPGPDLAVRSEPQPTPPGAGITGEEGQAGERERELINSLTRDLASAREEVTLLKARLATEVAERLKVSQDMQSASTAAAEHRQALEREREAAAALARDLESTREQVEYLMAEAARAQAEVAEHKQALDRERKRAFILEPPVVVLGTPIPVKTTPVAAESPSKVPPSPLQHSSGPKNTPDEPTVRR